MKKLLSLICLLALLLTALPARAEFGQTELHTFAGIPWGASIQQFVSVAQRGGLPVENNSSHIDLIEGYYAIFGMPLDPDCFSVKFSSPGNQQLTAIEMSLEDVPCELDEQGNAVIPEVLRSGYHQFLERYGTPTSALLILGSDDNCQVYLPDPSEAPWLLEDLLQLANRGNWTRSSIVVCCSNVVFRARLWRDESPYEFWTELRFQSHSYDAMELAKVAGVPSSLTDATPLHFQGGAPIVFNIIP